jgi:4-hydroxy-3-methylbut-2-enyl diphosphate reductase
VHNPVVTEKLDALGIQHGSLRNAESATTAQVIITAHGAADRDRRAWKARGFQVTDTTCPLVKKAHSALALLVRQGYHPVVIGKRDHVEVMGLTGDFPEADVILSEQDLRQLRPRKRFGVVSQTTQPTSKVAGLVEALRIAFPQSEVRYVDTVCQPTKDRQTALEDLCRQVEVVIAVGGANSNNTRQLVTTAQSYGVRAHRVANAGELQAEWFDGVETVGVTAGTSTLEETVREVYEALKAWTPLPEALC